MIGSLTILTPLRNFSSGRVTQFQHPSRDFPTHMKPKDSTSFESPEMKLGLKKPTKTGRNCRDSLSIPSKTLLRVYFGQVF